MVQPEGESEGAKTTKGRRQGEEAEGSKREEVSSAWRDIREKRALQGAGSSRAGLYTPARSAPSQSAGPTQALTQPARPPRHPTTRLPALHPPPGAVPRLQSLPQLGSWALTEPERDGRRDPEGRTHRGTARERARAKQGPARATGARVSQGWENLVPAPPQPRPNKPD